ncbi:unnamed protein product [Prunus armeniaca]
MPKMKRKQLLLLVFALLMLIAPDAAESVLEFETAPARKSLVATRYMLATWVSLIFQCLLPMIVFFFSFFSFFFFQFGL